MSTFSISPAVSVLTIAIVRWVELQTRRDVIPGRVLERLSLRLLKSLGYAVLIFSLLEWSLRGRPFVPLAFGVGWLLAIASFALRWWAIATLGRMWSLHVEIRRHHELILAGPFRFVRHPTYLSVILEFAALALICSAWWTLLLLPMFLVPALRHRILIEECALLEKFPAYADFQRNTPAVFPWRGRRRP